MAFDGELFSVLTYRAAHSPSERQGVISWLSQYYSATCSSIVVPNAAISGSCTQSIREAWCYQTCNPGTVQLAGFGTNWCGMRRPACFSNRPRPIPHVYCRCGPGTWSWAPVICKQQCPSFSPPANVATCNKTVVYVDFTGAYDMRWFIAFP